MLTPTKQNGHNNAEFEKQYAAPGETTSVLLDKVVTLISLIQYEQVRNRVKSSLKSRECVIIFT